MYNNSHNKVKSVTPRQTLFFAHDFRYVPQRERYKLLILSIDLLDFNVLRIKLQTASANVLCEQHVTFKLKMLSFHRPHQ